MMDPMAHFAVKNSIVDVIAAELFTIKRDALCWPPVTWAWCCENMPSLASEMRIKSQDIIAKINHENDQKNLVNHPQKMDLAFKEAFLSLKD